MTREEATQNIDEIDFLTCQIDIIEDMLDQIYNDHETAIEILMKANEEEISRHFNELKAKDEEIERLKKQYHQCLDDYIKCDERKEQQ